MTASDNDRLTIARRFLELLDHQDWDALREATDANVRSHIGNDHVDREAWIEMGRMFYGAFPDGRHEIERQIVGEDCVVTIATWKGTHQGPLFGMPASGANVRMPVIMIDRIQDGKVVEHWGQFDSAGMMQQFGAAAAK